MLSSWPARSVFLRRGFGSLSHRSLSLSLSLRPDAKRRRKGRAQGRASSSTAATTQRETRERDGLKLESVAFGPSVRPSVPSLPSSLHTVPSLSPSLSSSGMLLGWIRTASRPGRQLTKSNNYPEPLATVHQHLSIPLSSYGITIPRALRIPR